MELKVIKLYEDAIIPTRAYPTDSGLDLYAYIKPIPLEERGNWTTEEDKVSWKMLAPQERLAVKTGIAIELPKKPSDLQVYGYGTGWSLPVVWEAQIRPKSGRAIKEGLTVLNTPGTIDNSYTGEIIVILYNSCSTSRIIKDGEKIAQLVICPVVIPELVVLDSPTLAEANNERGDKGFGSSGI